MSPILAAADAASEERAGSVFVLRGEPGIGKTRLIEKAEQRLGEEWFIAHRGVFMNFGAESSRDAAVFSLKEARGPRFHIAVGDLIDARTVPELKAVESALDAETKIEGLFDGLIALLRHSCTQHRRLIVFEDVHWAPNTAISLLNNLAKTVINERCKTIIKTRAEGGLMSRFALGKDIQDTVIDLAPLRERDAEALARVRLVGAPDLAQACVRRAEVDIS